MDNIQTNTATLTARELELIELALKGHFKLKGGKVVATNKAARAAKRAQTLAAKQGVLDVLSNFLDTELFTAHR